MADIEFEGPIFNGEAVRIFHDAEKDIQKTIAEKTLRGLKRHFHTHFRHSTGRYENRVHISSLGRGLEINDRGSVYGPWLEGTGSRNAPRTRFRGYHAFREVSEEMDHEAGRIAEERFHEKWLHKLE